MDRTTCSWHYSGYSTTIVYFRRLFFDNKMYGSACWHYGHAQLLTRGAAPEDCDRSVVENSRFFRDRSFEHESLDCLVEHWRRSVGNRIRRKPALGLIISPLNPRRVPCTCTAKMDFIGLADLKGSTVFGFDGPRCEFLLFKAFVNDGNSRRRRRKIRTKRNISKCCSYILKKSIRLYD